MTDARKTTRRSLLAGGMSAVLAFLFPRSASARSRRVTRSNQSSPYSFLRDKRQELGLSVEQMAFCLDILPRSLRRYEAGGNVPPPVVFLAELMGSALVFSDRPNGLWSVTNVSACLLNKPEFISSLPPIIVAGLSSELRQESQG